MALGWPWVEASLVALVAQLAGVDVVLVQPVEGCAGEMAVFDVVWKSLALSWYIYMLLPSILCERTGFDLKGEVMLAFNTCFHVPELLLTWDTVSSPTLSAANRQHRLSSLGRWQSYCPHISHCFQISRGIPDSPHHRTRPNRRLVLLLPDGIDRSRARYPFLYHSQNLTLDRSPNSVEDESGGLLERCYWMKASIGKFLLEQWEDPLCGASGGHELYYQGLVLVSVSFLSGHKLRIRT